MLVKMAEVIKIVVHHFARRPKTRQQGCHARTVILHGPIRGVLQALLPYSALAVLMVATLKVALLATRTAMVAQQGAMVMAPMVAASREVGSLKFGKEEVKQKSLGPSPQTMEVVIPIVFAPSQLAVTIWI